MSNPLTTPSSVPSSTPVPRNPDGSPLPRQRMKAAIERVKKKLGIPEEPYEFNEAEAAAFFEKYPDIVAKVDNGDIVTMEVQEPKWVSDEEAAKIRADIATATDNQVINPASAVQVVVGGDNPAVDAVLTDVTVEPADPEIIKEAFEDAEQAFEEAKTEMTPQQKRAATLAAKRAAKEAEQNG